MSDALRALTLRGARLRPVVLVFEDLHWMDTSTEEYLGSLMDSVASAPLMLLLTYRTGYAPPLGARSFFTTLTLHSLSLAQTITTPREIWTGHAALGKVLTRLGRDEEAERPMSQAALTIEGILAKLTAPRLRHSLMTAEPVQEIYRTLGRRPPHVPA